MSEKMREATACGAPRIRARVVLAAWAGVVPIVWFVQWSDLRVGGTMVAGPFPPLAASLQWALLLAANRALRPVLRGQTLLTRSELLVVLAAWLAANMVAGRGLLHPLLSSIAGPVYYARSGVAKDAVSRSLPSWLALADRASASGFFEGHGLPVPWAVWRRPLLTWALFFAPFLTANVCLCALFERVWVRQERLAFPLVALPLEALRWGDGGTEERLVRRAAAFGLAAPLLLHGFGVLNAYAPGVPCISFYNEISALLPDPPWSAARPLFLNVYPLLIGLTFLAPADVTLSVWFFLLLNKVEMVTASAMGWNDGTTGGATSVAPYVEEQSAGAFLALAAVLVWNARSHLGGIFAARSDPERRACRPLALGFLAGVAGVLAWGMWTGMPLWFGACFFGFYLTVALVLGRLMAEGGIPWILAPILPDKLLLSLTGSAALAPAAITRLMLHVQHLRDTRQMLAPCVLQTGKLRDVAGSPLRAFYALVLGATALALVVGVAAALPVFYSEGALAMAPNSDGLQMSAIGIPATAVAHATTRLSGGIRPDPAAGAALAAGGLATWALYLARVRFVWWPLHPLGYALTGTLQLGYANKMLFSIFAGWALKSLALRFGGARGFRALRGAAIGLILGDLLMGSILKLLDALLGPSGYAIF
jgi:hypothetical protein